MLLIGLIVETAAICHGGDGVYLCVFADKLKEYFGKYGEITESMVMRDPVTRRSR